MNSICHGHPKALSAAKKEGDEGGETKKPENNLRGEIELVEASPDGDGALVNRVHAKDNTISNSITNKNAVQCLDATRDDGACIDTGAVSFSYPTVSGGLGFNLI